MPKKILITCIGSRGDAQPFIALGLFLKPTYTVIIAAHPECKNWIEAEGFTFAPIGASMVDAVASEEGRKLAQSSIFNVVRVAKAFFGKLLPVW